MSNTQNEWMEVIGEVVGTLRRTTRAVLRSKDFQAILLTTTFRALGIPLLPTWSSPSSPDPEPVLEVSSEPTFLSIAPPDPSS